MKIGIVVKPQQRQFEGQLKFCIDWLEEHGAEIMVDSRVADEMGVAPGKSVELRLIPERADVVIVFGGDGTLLSVARHINENGAALLGVNLGSLGFMTEVTLDELPTALERLLEGRYQVSHRCLLKVELQRGNGQVSTFQALNDAVINKGALARIISLDVYSNESFIANFLADGIIVATPTGSTAYSMSAGGPIIFPTEELITLTPICPHTLTNRPLIIPAETQVRISLRSGDDVMVTIDGQVGMEMGEGDTLTCTRADHRLQLIQPGEKNFFDILREKLKWSKR